MMMSSCHKKSSADGDAELPVAVAMPEVDTVTLTKSYPGYLQAQAVVQLVARVNGYLRTKDYASGQFVNKGQVLFTIEDTQYRDALAQAEAQLATARSTYEYNKNNYEAMKKALESDAVARISVIQAESEMKNSLAAIHNAEAAVQSARTNLGYCTVRAPFNGHVTASGPDPGAYLAGAGSPVTLATIYDDSQMGAVFNIEDTQFMRMMDHKGDGHELDYARIPVTFEDTLPHRYTAKLSYISPEIDKSTGTLLLKAELDNSYGELKDGMYANITLPYAIVPDAILVKDASISTDQAGKYVYVVNDSNKVVYTPIKTGELVRDSMRIVTSGLTPQSRYVTQALLKVRDGMEVKPIQQK
ncbi:MAG: efflux RND transporter periplasmic adaptor subunit [Candidatus Amulumruptor sp.]